MLQFVCPPQQHQGMIFVCIAYENVQQHTAGFLGLQVVLILVAVQNVLYIIDADVSYNFLGGIKRTRQVAITYLGLLLVISAVKVSHYFSGCKWIWRRLDPSKNCH